MKHTTQKHDLVGSMIWWEDRRLEISDQVRVRHSSYGYKDYIDNTLWIVTDPACTYIPDITPTKLRAMAVMFNEQADAIDAAEAAHAAQPAQEAA